MNKELSYLSEEELKKDPDLLMDLLKMMILFHFYDRPEEVERPLFIPLPNEMGWNILVAKLPDQLACQVELSRKLPESIEEAVNENSCVAIQSLVQKVEADVLGEAETNGGR